MSPEWGRSRTWKSRISSSLLRRPALPAPTPTPSCPPNACSFVLLSRQWPRGLLTRQQGVGTLGGALDLQNWVLQWWACQARCRFPFRPGCQLSVVVPPEARGPSGRGVDLRALAGIQSLCPLEMSPVDMCVFLGKIHRFCLAFGRDQ